MQINHSTEIKLLLKKYLNDCKEDILIISAFVKKDTLIWIDKNLIHLKRKKLLVRFQRADILHGATDFEIIDYCIKNGWEIKFDLRLHSKVYVFDKSKFILGSANATGSGLSLIKNANIESVVSGHLSDQEYINICQIFVNGNTFTRELIELMEIDLLQENRHVASIASVWNENIILNITKPREIVLLKEDLLTSESPMNLTQQDIILLNLKHSEISIEETRMHFLSSKIYNWLLLKLSENDNNLYFGELSSLLHESIALNEKVYRKDIKIYLSNLINWICHLGISEIAIDRPNHSQRIRLNI
ncbi:phospholipase D-like domain-containing protein [Planococcus koreensis]|uniref:phospholipase D-like domain-containing protein n=1 Tax=Planococcus koreensis TaxID=112331 RepID=UPI0039FBA098